MGPNAIGPNEIGPNAMGPNAIGPNVIGPMLVQTGGEKNPAKKLPKYPNAKTIGIFKLETSKEIYLDNYYSKDFLKNYFSS